MLKLLKGRYKTVYIISKAVFLFYVGLHFLGLQASRYYLKASENLVHSKLGIVQAFTLVLLQSTPMGEEHLRSTIVVN